MTQTTCRDGLKLNMEMYAEQNEKNEKQQVKIAGKHYNKNKIFQCFFIKQTRNMRFTTD